MADNTVYELCKAALRKIGANASGETPTDAEMQEALFGLKHMLRAWSSSGQRIFETTIVTHTLDGSQSYTIGSGADIDTTRPVRIHYATVSSSGLDYPMEIISEREYAEIALKSDGSNIPAWLWYNPGYSIGTLYIYPPGSGTLTLYTDVPLTDPTTLTEDVTLPGEYHEAIVWNLACDLCPEYGREPTPYMLLRAQQTKRTIISINAALSMPVADLEVVKAARRYSINEG